MCKCSCVFAQRQITYTCIYVCLYLHVCTFLSMSLYHAEYMWKFWIMLSEGMNTQI